MGAVPLRWIVGLVLFGLWSGAGQAQLIRDFSPGSSESLHRLGGAHGLVNDHLLVEIDDPELGAELWTVDTADGIPRLLADFDPQIRTSGRQQLPLRVAWVGPDFALLDIQFSALWVTDGTVEGTRELRSTLQLLQVLGRLPGSQRVVFTGFEGGRIGLWATDGSAQGTVSLFEAEARSGGFSPLRVAQWEGRLVFLGSMLQRTEALWQTDGTREGTRPLVDFVPEGADPNVTVPEVSSRGLHFLVFPAGQGTELWGIAEPGAEPRRLATIGTALERRIVLGRLWPVGRQIFFVAGPNELTTSLWRWDPDAPVPLEEVAPSFGPDTEIWLDGSAHDGRTLSFWVFYYATRGAEVWSSDGTRSGLRRAYSAPTPSVSFKVSEVRHGSGGFVFATHDPPANLEIRRFEEPLVPPQVIFSRPARFGPRSFLFRDRVGFYVSEPGAFSYWSTDGSAAGPDLLFRGDLSAGQSGACVLLEKDRLGCFGLAPDRQADVWVSEGTPATTTHRTALSAFEPIGVSSSISFVAGAPEGVYFQLQPSQTSGGLWRTDGTDAGTRLVLDRAAVSGFVAAVASTGGLSYVLVLSSSVCGVWAFPAGEGEPRCLVTNRLFDIATTIHQGQLYFIANGSVFRGQGLASPIELSADRNARALVSTSRGVFFLGESSLGSTDGTVAGTRVITELPGFAGELAAIGDQLYFTMNGTSSGESKALWTSDGSLDGTKVLAPLPAERTPGPLRMAGGRLFLVATAPDSWEELWTLDPRVSEPSWRLARRIGRNARVEDLKVLGSRLLFASEDSRFGEELWVSDGTEEGTRLLLDLWPGRLGSRPRDLTLLDGGLVAFSAAEPARGREPWLTDGSVEGTRRLADLAPGRRSSLPEHFALSAGKVFLAATDGTRGRELFSVPLSGLPDAENEPPFGPWLASPSVPGFRFKVRIGDAPGIAGVRETACLAETLCVSGAVRGRSEVFLRIVGPRPNGLLWPSLIKFTTSAVEVWIEQLATGALRHYRLEGARPEFDELPGFFDRDGFVP